MSSPFTRRKFIQANSVALLATQLPAGGAAAETAADPDKLAKAGGAKAVKAKPGRRVRWDDREKQQLGSAVDQASLFYWAGGKPNQQTGLFIERFKQYCPSEHVVTCSSGTAALHIAIAAAGIGPGDEVITTPITDIGTVTGILFQQGVPVFADLGASTYNLDPASVERSITLRTKAIIAVHLTGAPCDMSALQAIAQKHNLVLIEDCAQAWGAQVRGKPVGSFGHVACYSLMDSKHICAGDGGVVASSDKRIGPALLKFSDKGNDRMAPGNAWDKTGVLATNYRMSELQAAFAAVQLQRLEGIASKRAALGRLLIEGIGNLPAVLPPRIAAADRATFWFFYFRLKLDRLKCNRAEFVEALRAEGVSCNAGYIPVPVYKLPYFQQHSFFAGRWPIKELGLTAMDYTKVKCPEAEAILSTGIQMPLHEAMDEALIRESAAAIRKVAKAYTT
ncbi:DegT/DnrJ/EryC1/StrS family aminotransferase [Horticoccus sp. 23ND18S-11]|uniref:DegT/DnrJ/EryC1/StrS family aminotransferase n=1 Tax=Horticoccus sp. 23ND18S-11 TaxID=3391832 RepID=UPI0039C95A53